MPKVSVLVPVYNVEKYLRECLESILNQTLADIEIICINDGSKDNSAKILHEYELKDKRIKVINKENSGYGHSMNIGLNIASGEYIGIVEPDDFCRHEMFNDLYYLAKKYSTDIVKSEYYEILTKNGFLQKRKTGFFPKFKTNEPFSLKECPALIRKPPSIWSGIYKREFLINHNIKFLETAGASFQDTSFSFKALSLADRILLTPKAYLCYRTDNENSSVNSKDKVFAICKEYDEITIFLNTNPQIKKFINTQKLIKQYVTYMWNLERIEASFRSEFVDNFSDTFKKYYENSEINSAFYEKVNKKELEKLIYNKRLFLETITEKIEKNKQKENRRKLFSFHLNTSRVSIVLFGRQILEIG